MKEKKIVKENRIAGVLGSKMFEEVYDPSNGQYLFAVWDGQEVTYKDQIKMVIGIFEPVESNMIRKGTVKLPSIAEEYGSEETLLGEIQSFIHRYVDY